MSKLPPSTAGHDQAAGDWAEAHARYWAHWVDAGRLWMSWWANALPALPWLPAGRLPPQDPAPASIEASATATSPGRNEPAPKADTAHKPSPRPRAAAARHH